MSLLYEVRGLVRRYGRVTALDLPALGVDELRIHSGQVLTPVGYNGSGKSTLLRLLAFLEVKGELAETAWYRHLSLRGRRSWGCDAAVPAEKAL